MKSALSALALAFISTASTAALADDQVFQGDIFFTTASANSAACVNAGTHQYDYLRMAIRPASAVNGPHTQINVYGPRFAYHFQINNHALSGNGKYSGVGLGSKGNSWTWVATFSAASTAPAKITNATKAITVKVTLANFAGWAGCTVTLGGTLGLRPGI